MFKSIVHNGFLIIRATTFSSLKLFLFRHHIVLKVVSKKFKKNYFHQKGNDIIVIQLN